MRNAVIAAATLLLASTVASAQPAMTAPMEPLPAPAIEMKSGSTAAVLAVGTTLGGLAVMYAGAEQRDGAVVLGGMAMMMIGPSAGHFYAGETGHGVKMSLLRTGGLVLLGVGLVTSSSVTYCAATDVEAGSCSTRDSHTRGELMMWIGGATIVGATLYDLWDARNAAHRANEKAVRSWTVAPSIMAGATGSTIPALTVGGSF
jgi:hypothetical protein